MKPECKTLGASVVMAALIISATTTTVLADFRLRLVREGETNVRFTVSGCPTGVCYMAEWCTNLSAPQWRPLAMLGGAGVVMGDEADGEKQVLEKFSLWDIGNPPQAYFRLRCVEPVAEVFTPVAGGKAVALLVDTSLADQLRSAIDQFASDLRLAGYSTFVADTAFTTPDEVRAYLLALYRRTHEQLQAAILIGPQPRAYQWYRYVYTNPNLPPTEQESISFQYYCDLDGRFSASPDYQSPGGHSFSFDKHEGSVDWEIVIGVLPVYEGDLTLTVEAINRYFARNHDYRTGQLSFPPI